VISAQQEDELRGFFNLIARRTPGGGALSWALARYEMGAERLGPFEALTDYLLAARALLEPEGPAAGRLPVRLAAICANPDRRLAVSARIAQAVALERSVMLGETVPAPGSDALVLELSEYIRALLRDMVCGHLGLDVCALADDLLAEPTPSELLAPDPEHEDVAPEPEQDTAAFELEPAGID
jgi:hypothetical protein